MSTGFLFRNASDPVGPRPAPKKYRRTVDSTVFLRGFYAVSTVLRCFGGRPGPDTVLKKKSRGSKRPTHTDDTLTTTDYIGNICRSGPPFVAADPLATVNLPGSKRPPERLGSVWGARSIWAGPVPARSRLVVAAPLCGAAAMVICWGPKTDYDHILGPKT